MCFDGNQAIRIRRTYSGIGTDRTADYQSNGSDTAKFLEAACYALSKHEDSKLRALVDEQIGWIRTSQWDDGYINSYFTLVEPQNRFTNLRFSSDSNADDRDAHELYCAGHLLEAAIAYYQLTQKTDFLNAMTHYVSLIQSTFGEGEHQLHGYPGHEELELALIKLYRLTNASEYLELARYFVEERGQRRNGIHYYEIEAKLNGVTLWPPNFKREGWFEYMQAGQVIREQSSIEGKFRYSLNLLQVTLSGQCTSSAACQMSDCIPKIHHS